jgi:hypothetical protein
MMRPVRVIYVAYAYVPVPKSLGALPLQALSQALLKALPVFQEKYRFAQNLFLQRGFWSIQIAPESA